MIDGTTAMVLVGAVIQAVPPTRGLVMYVQRRIDAREPTRPSSFSLVPGASART